MCCLLFLTSLLFTMVWLLWPWLNRVNKKCPVPPTPLEVVCCPMAPLEVRSSSVCVSDPSIGSLVLGPNPVEFVGFVVNNKHYGVWCAFLDRPPINPAWFIVGVWLVRDKGCSFDEAGPFRFLRVGGFVIVSSLLCLCAAASRC